MSRADTRPSRETCSAGATNISGVTPTSPPCAGSAHDARPELAGPQQAIAGALAPSESAAHAGELVRGLAARYRFIARPAMNAQWLRVPLEAQHEQSQPLAILSPLKALAQLRIVAGERSLERAKGGGGRLGPSIGCRRRSASTAGPRVGSTRGHRPRREEVARAPRVHPRGMPSTSRVSAGQQERSLFAGALAVGDPGLEPGTSSLSEKRSNRLS
jgi:hypothetical protein